MEAAALTPTPPVIPSTSMALSLRSSAMRANALAGPSSLRLFSSTAAARVNKEGDKVILNRYSRMITQSKTQGASQVST